MRNFYLLFLTLGLSVFSFGQDDRIQKAGKILNSARNAIYKGVKLSDVKSFQAEKEITGFGEMEVIQPGKSNN